MDGYLAEIDALIARHADALRDHLRPAIEAGRASRDVVRRVALEDYYRARWTTPELALLIAAAPDGHAFTMDRSTHYGHWARHFAGATGYLGAPNRVQAMLDRCRSLGLAPDEVRSYTPIPETIAMTCTQLYYARRSYAEGLAVLGYADARLAGGRDAVVVDLFRLVVTTGAVQEACRVAIRNHLLTAGARVRVMNRWVE